MNPLSPLHCTLVASQSASLTPSDVEAFVGLYERHIGREERELLPMAARLLSDVQLDGIGRAMRERRGIHWEHEKDPTSSACLKSSR